MLDEQGGKTLRGDGQELDVFYPLYHWMCSVHLSVCNWMAGHVIL